MTLNKQWKNTSLGEIPADWSLQSLGSLLYINGRIGWKGLKISEYLKSGYAIINGEQINGERVTWKDVGRISQERYAESPEIMLKKDDILMTKDGTIGKIAYIDDLPEPATVASGIFVVRKNSDLLDQKYLWYYLKSHFFKHLIKYRTEGSVIPHLYQRDFVEMDIALPSMKEQKIISWILSSVDEKIRLLQKQNETMQSLAELLFKQWFVDEHSQSRHEEPLDKIADYLNGLACQKYPPKNEIDKLPVLKIKDLRNGFSEGSDWARSDVDPKYYVELGDVIFSWSGSLMIKIWDGQKCILNQHLFKVTSLKYPKWYYYLWTKHHLEKFISIADSKATTMGHIKREDITSSMVLVPSAKELKTMNEEMDPIFAKIILNYEQIKILGDLRRTMLPKLINGEIRLKRTATYGS
jgi:type I restriction enzyme S subunit